MTTGRSPELKKKVLILWKGDLDFHTPKATSELLAAELEKAGCGVTVEKGFAALDDLKSIKRYDLIIPQWTMGKLTNAQSSNLSDAVRSGVGIGGVHGGTGDAFRGNLGYQWMIGGQFVGHPYTGDYTVRILAKRSSITRGMKTRFKYSSEQYYMIVDPAIDILADTIYNSPEGKKVTLPVVWTKMHGKGRVFYSALGHVVEEFHRFPDALKISVRGLLWAASA